LSVTDELIAANARYAASGRTHELPQRPGRHLAVLTCMDARIDTFSALGLDLGDANILRNAGGRAAPALRSLAVCCGLLGVREIVVIHHTDCGLFDASNDEIRARLGRDIGPEAAEAAAGIDFLPFPDLDQSVREDVALIRASPLIPDDVSVRGCVYYVETGRLQEVH
jgi:carbonic anhydrase